MLIVAAVTGAGLTRFPSLNGDEGIYTQQARAVLHGSLSPYTYTYDHPFLGWVQLSVFAGVAQALHLGGALSVVNTRFVMLALQLVNVGLVYGIARRIGLQWMVATLGVLLFALSPLTIDLTRQVYLDNIAMPWVLLAFYLMLNRGRNQWTYACAGAVFAVGVLSKETVVLLLPALACLLYRQVGSALRLMVVTLTGAMFAVLVMAYPLFALLRGELLPGAGHVSLWTNGIMYQLASRAGSGAIWTATSNKRQLLAGWLSFDHFLLAAGLIAAVLTVLDRKFRWLTVAVLMTALPILKPGGYLPAMYVVIALPFLALSIAAALGSAWAKVQPSNLGKWVVAIVGTLMVVTAGPSYAQGHSKVTADTIGPAAGALHFLLTHVSSADTVLTDDSFIVDLNRHGLIDPWHGAVSYYKYDLDPSARKQLPHGYQDLTLIVDTPQMRNDIVSENLQYTGTAVGHSYVIASFGDGDARIEIRKLGTAPPALLPAPPSATPRAEQARAQVTLLERQFSYSTDMIERERLLAERHRLLTENGTLVSDPGPRQ